MIPKIRYLVVEFACLGCTGIVGLLLLYTLTTRGSTQSPTINDNTDKLSGDFVLHSFQEIINTNSRLDVTNWFWLSEGSKCK